MNGEKRRMNQEQLPRSEKLQYPEREAVLKRLSRQSGRARVLDWCFGETPLVGIPGLEFLHGFQFDPDLAKLKPILAADPDKDTSPYSNWVGALHYADEDKVVEQFSEPLKEVYEFQRREVADIVKNYQRPELRQIMDLIAHACELIESQQTVQSRPMPPGEADVRAKRDLQTIYGSTSTADTEHRRFFRRRLSTYLNQKVEDKKTPEDLNERLKALFEQAYRLWIILAIRMMVREGNLEVEVVGKNGRSPIDLDEFGNECFVIDLGKNDHDRVVHFKIGSQVYDLVVKWWAEPNPRNQLSHGKLDGFLSSFSSESLVPSGIFGKENALSLDRNRYQTYVMGMVAHNAQSEISRALKWAVNRSKNIDQWKEEVIDLRDNLNEFFLEFDFWVPGELTAGELRQLDFERLFIWAARMKGWPYFWEKLQALPAVQFALKDGQIDKQKKTNRSGVLSGLRRAFGIEVTKTSEEIGSEAEKKADQLDIYELVSQRPLAATELRMGVANPALLALTTRRLQVSNGDKPAVALRTYHAQATEKGALVVPFIPGYELVALEVQAVQEETFTPVTAIQEDTRIGAYRMPVNNDEPLLFRAEYRVVRLEQHNQELPAWSVSDEKLHQLQAACQNAGLTPIVAALQEVAQLAEKKNRQVTVRDIVEVCTQVGSYAFPDQTIQLSIDQEPAHILQQISASQEKYARGRVSSKKIGMTCASAGALAQACLELVMPDELQGRVVVSQETIALFDKHIRNMNRRAVVNNRDWHGRLVVEGPQQEIFRVDTTPGGSFVWDIWWRTKGIKVWLESKLSKNKEALAEVELEALAHQSEVEHKKIDAADLETKAAYVRELVLMNIADWHLGKAHQEMWPARFQKKVLNVLEQPPLSPEMQIEVAQHLTDFAEELHNLEARHQELQAFLREPSLQKQRRIWQVYNHIQPEMSANTIVHARELVEMAQHFLEQSSAE